MKWLLAFAFVLCPLAIFAQSEKTCSIKTCSISEPCRPGETVSIKSESFTSEAAIKAEVTLSPARPGSDSQKTTIASMDTEKHTVCLVIPKGTPDGTYIVHISANTQPPAQSGEIQNLDPNQITVLTPYISAVSPRAAFSTPNNTNQVTVLGAGFLKGKNIKDVDRIKEAEKLTLRFVDSSTPNHPCGGEIAKDCYTLKIKSDNEVTLEFRELDASQPYYKGPRAFVIDVDGVETKPASLTLVPVSRDVPTTVAVVGLLLVIVVIFLVIRSGAAAIRQKFGSKTYLLQALFLDVQTNSYSLSKCQFYAWTAAAVFGYLFLAVCKSVVQGSATFPDIPSGLPGILLASAGTAVLSTGIANAKGDKGAGDPQPSLSDFITTGGLVAADRLQFAVWTIIGIATFLGIIFQSDPSSINDLPSIPSGFMQLMGISAGGYLAGKLARQAGPTLTGIASSGTPTKIKVQLTGSALSKAASFSIDDKPIFPDQILGRDDQPAVPEIVEQDPTISDSSFARVLRFSVLNPPKEWFGGPHKFTITNPDAQRAVINYQIFWIDNITISAATRTLTLTGACLDGNLKVKYGPAPGAPATDATPQPNQASTTTYVYDVPNVTAAGTNVAVSVTDNVGMKFEKTVTVT
ncbi:MAG TPA: hypothetical protein VNV88_08350 [Candidatus Solibacter sp.]|jgi:hypothetical protein|nr:hypothetical protein [Candidatus Solibacter sp.]